MVLFNQFLASPNHLVRPRQHVRRNRQADLIGRFEVDNELEFPRLLHRKIGGLCALKDLVHISAVRRSGPSGSPHK